MPEPERIKLSQAVVVEGRYDKIRLEPVIDALILTTNGFRIFTDAEMQAFIRKLAAERGVIILTDSDAAGFKIRGFLRGMLPREQVTDVYIPDILGRERRKSAPSKEGKLGVEGMDAKILLEAFARAGVTPGTAPERGCPITRLDLYEDGFTGGENSALKRRALYEALGLPSRLSAGAVLPLLNSMMTREEYRELVNRLNFAADA